MPKLDPALATLIEDLDQRGLLDETLVIAIGEFGRSPIMGVSTSGNSNAPDGRDHWPYCYTAMIAGAGVGRGVVYGKSDKHASSPVENPVHPTELLATIYHAVGLAPDTVLYNDLGQPGPSSKPASSPASMPETKRSKLHARRCVAVIHVEIMAPHGEPIVDEII